MRYDINWCHKKHAVVVILNAEESGVMLCG